MGLKGSGAHHRLLGLLLVTRRGDRRVARVVGLRRRIDVRPPRLFVFGRDLVVARLRVPLVEVGQVFAEELLVGDGRVFAHLWVKQWNTFLLLESEALARLVGLRRIADVLVGDHELDLVLGRRELATLGSLHAS